MAEFEIIEREGLRLVKISLHNEVVRAEAGAMYYMRGKIDLETKTAGGVGGFFKALATGESFFRPSYKGTGEVYLEPSFEGFHILELTGDEWVMDSGSYWASDGHVEINARANNFLTGILGGEGLFQTTAKGYGKVVFKTPGPIKEVVLENGRLVVDGNFAVARTGGLSYKVDKDTKGWAGFLAAGEGFVNTYEGTGKVLLAEFPYRRAMMVDQIEDIITSKVSAAKSSGSSSSSDSD